MPIYEYQCGGCGEVFEVLQRYDDPAPKSHEDCGSKKVQRIMSSTAFVFKGEGWYITDYARKDQEKKKKGKKGGSSSEGTGGSSGGDGSSSSSSSGGSSASAA